MNYLDPTGVYQPMQWWGNNQMQDPTAFLRQMQAFSRPASGAAPVAQATPPAASPWDGQLGATYGAGSMDSMGAGWGGTGVGPNATPFEPSAYQRFTGYRAPDGTGEMGWGGMALGAASSLGNLWLGMKQYGLAKEQLAFSKDSFSKNWGAQVNTTNAALSDRQAARVASNPGAYDSVASYMAKYGIKG